MILDFGFWSRCERNEVRAWAARLGAEVRVRHEDVPVDEFLARRNAVGRADALAVFEADLGGWASVFEPPAPDERG